MGSGAFVAQLVEHNLAKVEVAGSRPVECSAKSMLRGTSGGLAYSVPLYAAWLCRSVGKIATLSRWRPGVQVPSESRGGDLTGTTGPNENFGVSLKGSFVTTQATVAEWLGDSLQSCHMLVRFQSGARQAHEGYFHQAGIPWATYTTW